MMKYRIDPLHKKNGKEVYMISLLLNESGTYSRPLIPGKVFPTVEAAKLAAKAALKEASNN